MANTILVASREVEGPPLAPPTEEPPMPEHAPWPRHYFSKDEPEGRVKDSGTGVELCGSRLFQSQDEVNAAGGAAVWKATPQEAAAATPPAPAEDAEEAPHRRSHR